MELIQRGSYRRLQCTKGEKFRKKTSHKKNARRGEKKKGKKRKIQKKKK